MEQYAATFRYDERATKLRKSIYILWAKLRLLWHIRVKEFKVIDHPPQTFSFGVVAIMATGKRRRLGVI